MRKSRCRMPEGERPGGPKFPLSDASAASDSTVKSLALPVRELVAGGQMLGSARRQVEKCRREPQTRVVYSSRRAKEVFGSMG
jgi:hypothetical protein